jgi:hypothetical protein
MTQCRDKILGLYEFAAPAQKEKATRGCLLAMLKGVEQSGKDEIEERVAAWHLWRPPTGKEDFAQVALN